MGSTARGARHVKGVNLVDLVKVLKAHGRSHSLDGLGDGARELLDQRILPTEWYPLEAHLELLDFTFDRLLGRSEIKAAQMGQLGARAVLTTFHRAFIRKGQPLQSALGMRHLWAAYFDFGTLDAEAVGDRAVRFVIDEYPDIPAVHGVMVAAWHTTAPELAGAQGVTCEWRERAWKGSTKTVYVVKF
jgi:hypothetical protein